MSSHQFHENLKSSADNATRLMELIVDKNRSGTVGSKFYWFSGPEMAYYPIC